VKHLASLASLRFASIILPLLALCCGAVAQNPPHSGKISVPFGFNLGGTNFPAGQYTLSVISPSYGQIRSNDGKLQQTMYFMQTGEPDKNPRALFAARNNKYFFSGVVGWFGKMQYTGFSPHADDQTKEIPITGVE